MIQTEHTHTHHTHFSLKEQNHEFSTGSCFGNKIIAFHNALPYSIHVRYGTNGRKGAEDKEHSHIIIFNENCQALATGDSFQCKLDQQKVPRI